MEAPSSDWVVFALCTYGLLYALILRAGWREMAVLEGQVSKLGAGACAMAAGPLRQKHRAFRWFLLLVLGELALEGVCRYLLAAQSVSFFALVAVYEVTSTVLLICIGACFAPRAYSPFHFMVPTSLELGAPGQEAEGVDAEEGAGGAGTGSDEARTARVRRALSSRHRSREQEEDVAAMDRLRLARAQR